MGIFLLRRQYNSIASSTSPNESRYRVILQASVPKRKKPRAFLNVAFLNAGNYLLSHTLSRAVQSAQRGLT